MTTLTATLPARHVRSNLTIRQVRTAGGILLGYLTERHDGSPESMLEAARRITEQMFRCFPDASNIQSLILATDRTGRPRWSISQNFRFITEC